MALSFIVLGLLGIAVALHPFLTYPLSLWFLSRWRSSPLPPPLATSAASSSGPSPVAICMCAYNEEGVIEAKIANLLALKRENPGLEVLVYVDAATDHTAELLRAHSDQLRLIVGAERMGKTHGMNLLVSLTDKPILLFTDANVMLDVHAPSRLLRYFADPSVGCVAGHLRYINPGDSVTAYTGSLYWRLDEWTKRLETATGSAVGADGSLFAIRRELHQAPPDDIIDDMYVSMMIGFAGRRVVQVDDVIAYEQSVSVARDEFERKIRIGCCAFNAHRVLWPQMREQSALAVYKYVSHKLIRWCTIFFLAFGALFFELGLVLARAGLLAACLAGAAALGLTLGATTTRGPLAQAWDILVAFSGTGLGVLRALRGESFRTWTPVGSIRK